LKDEHKSLQDEVRAIDEDLLSAVDAEGISLDELLQSSKKLPIEVQ
jgi:hypothetical protein